MTPRKNPKRFLFFREAVLSKFVYICACGVVGDAIYCDILLLAYLDVLVKILPAID